MTAPAASTRIHVLRGRSKVGFVLGTLVMAFFAAIAVYGIVSGQLHGVGEHVLGYFFAALFVGMTLWILASTPAVLARHDLVFDHAGFAYEVTWGRPSWRVGWDELRIVTVRTYANRARTNRTTLVWLEIVPLDAASFATRHPEMTRLRTGDVWKLDLGPNTYDIAPVSQALHDWAGPRDGGVADEPWTGRARMR